MPTSPRQVLVVEDPPAIGQMLHFLLRPADCNVIVVAAGAEALRRLRQDPIDAVVLDLALPDVRVGEVLAWLRATEHARHPVWVVVAAAKRDEVTRLYGELGSHLLPKPFNPWALVEQLRIAQAGKVTPQNSVCVGQRACIIKTVTEQDLWAFSKVSGDSNPLHSDPEYAAKTRFGQRIAHGAFELGLILAVLGTKLCPGNTVVYLAQSVRFLRPVFLNDRITAECAITAVSPDRPVATVACRCVNQFGEGVLEGEATILFDPFPFDTAHDDADNP